MTLEEELALWECDHADVAAAIESDARATVERHRRAIVAVLVGCEVDNADGMLVSDADLSVLVELLVAPLLRVATRAADLARENNDLRHQLARSRSLGIAARDRMAALVVEHREALDASRAEVTAACAKYKARVVEGDEQIAKYREQRDAALRVAEQMRQQRDDARAALAEITRTKK